MSTFVELYCSQHHCTPGDFHRRIFWGTLHWHALVFAPLFLLNDFFNADRRLITACAHATQMRQIHEEIHDHHDVAQNNHWLQRYGYLRISTRRLRRLAARYLTTQRSKRSRVVASAQLNTRGE